MKSNVVFYISERVIKFLQVSGAQKKLVTAVDIINIDKLSDAQISESLKGFIKKRKLNFASSRVTVLIPRSRAILRFMVFPSHKEDEIRSMIDLQVGGSIPYVREEVEIDFQVLSKTADGYARVAVVIIPQEIAMRYCNIFSDSKIPVHNISISAVGLWLLYQQLPEISNDLGAVFDFDLNHSEICFCYKTHWLTSREIPIGLEQIQKDGSAEIINQWELTQNSISQELKSKEQVESVYLLGSANRASAFWVEISKIRNLNVKQIVLTQSLSLARGVQWPKVVTQEGLSIACLAGVGFASQPVPINLIPRSLRQDQQQRAYQRQLVTLGIWLTAALLSLGVALGMGFFKKNIKLAHLESQLREVKHEAFNVEDRLQKIQNIKRIIDHRLIFADLAQELDHLLPPEVYLVNISLSNGNLSLEGVSSNSLSINQLQRDMVNARDFSNVSLDYVNKRITQQGEVNYFKITCSLNTVNN